LHPDAAATSDGGYVVVWAFDAAEDDDSIVTETDGIYARVFGPNWSSDGGHFRVDEGTDQDFVDRNHKDVATLADDSFIVTWVQYDQNQRDFVYARHFDNNGVALGGPYEVASSQSGDIGDLSVVGLPDGRYAIAWKLGTDHSLHLQIFDASGSAESDVVRVDDNLNGWSEALAIAVTPQQQIVATWQSLGGNSGKYVRFFDLQGVAQGDGLQLTEEALGQNLTSAALSDGSFILTWGQQSIESDSLEVYARHLGSNGSWLGDRFQVNTFEDGTQGWPRVASLVDGGFVIAWISWGQDATTWGGYARTYNSTAEPTSDELRASPTAPSWHWQAVESVVALTDGGFLLNWHGTGDNGYGIYGQLYDAQGSPIEAPNQGTPGDDVLDLTGPGGSIAFGGPGDDIFVVDDPDDQPVELKGEGVDTVQASLSWELGDNLENLVLTGDESIDGTGNELENVLEGNSASNILDGQRGADTMQGGLGSDTYYVDDENDDVIETSSTVALNRFSGGVARWRNGEPLLDIGEQDVADDIDQVISTVSFTLSEFVENLTLDGEDDIDGWGNGLDNTVVGNSGDNVLYSGEGGTDLLIGGEGEDTFVIDNTTGTTRIEDPEGGVDVLELKGFMLTSDVLELSFEEAAGSTLLIHNSSSGVVRRGAWAG
jgi:hypothetical protein